MLASITDLAKGQMALQPMLERATKLSAMFDDFVDNDEGDMHTRRPGIHASELGCERRVVYTLLGEKKDGRFSKKWKQRFKMGHAIHKMFQLDFLRMASKSRGLLQFEDEVKIAPEYQRIAETLKLDSSADGLFTFRDHPYGPAVLRVVLEIKSSSPDQYDKLTQPDPDHIRQTHLYMKALDAPLTWFLYVNKGNQNNTPSHAPWVIPYNDREWQSIEAVCHRTLKMAEDYPVTGALPDRSEGIFCEFCAYRLSCKPNYLQKRNNFKSRPVRAPNT